MGLKRILLLFLISLFFCAGVVYSAPNKKLVKNYNNAVKYHKSGDYRNAITYYNAVIKIDRKFWQAWLGLGICYYNMRKFSNARLIFRYVLSLQPGEATAKRYYYMLSGKQETAPITSRPLLRTRGDMMWRSALLPGLGQFYNNELAKAYIYTLSYLASIAAIIKYTIDQQMAVDAYTNANTDFNAKYKAAQDAGKKVIIPVATAGVIWAVALLDSYLSGKDEPPKKTVDIKMLDANTVAIAAVNYRF
jgi:tetratricopeptide (TPR) repeat protein